LKAEGDGWEVAGQVAVAATEKIHRVSLVPEDAAPPEAALAAIARADQVVIGPGSLYTSVLAAAAVPAIVDALAATSAQMVFVCNMRPQSPRRRTTASPTTLPPSEPMGSRSMWSCATRVQACRWAIFRGEGPIALGRGEQVGARSFEIGGSTRRSDGVIGQFRAKRSS